MLALEIYERQRHRNKCLKYDVDGKIYKSRSQLCSYFYVHLSKQGMRMGQPNRQSKIGMAWSNSVD